MIYLRNSKATPVQYHLARVLWSVVKGKELDVGGRNFRLLIYPSLGEAEKGRGSTLQILQIYSIAPRDRVSQTWLNLVLGSYGLGCPTYWILKGKQILLDPWGLKVRRIFGASVAARDRSFERDPEIQLNPHWTIIARGAKCLGVLLQARSIRWDGADTEQFRSTKPVDVV